MLKKQISILCACFILLLQGAKVAAQVFTLEPAATRCVSVGGGNTIRIQTAASATAALFPDWQLGPGLFEVNRGTITTTMPANNQYWIDVRGVAANVAGAFCPASVAFIWRIVSPTCTVTAPYLGSTLVSTVVSKQFTKADLDVVSNADPVILAPFSIFTESPPCVRPGDFVNVAIKPYHTCAVDLTQSQNATQIQPDETVWSATGPTPSTTPSPWILVYSSQDGTSATYKVVGTDPTTISCRMGRCNATAQVTRNFTAEAPPMSISAAGTGGLTFVLNTAGFPSATAPLPGRGCIVSNMSGNLVLTANGQDAGSVYTWSYPEAFFSFVSQSNNTITLTPRQGALGGSGTITCRVATTCNVQVASYLVNRTISQTANPITTNNIEWPPSLAGSVLPTLPGTCIYRDLRYTFGAGAPSTLPANNTYTWTPNTGAISYSPNSGINANTFITSISHTTTFGPPPTFALTLSANGPAAVNAPTLFCGSTSVFSPRLATEVPRTAAGSGQPNALQLVVSPGTFEIRNFNANPLLAAAWWNYGFPCSASLSAAAFHYEWGFVGTFTPTLGSAVTNESIALATIAKNQVAFTSATVATGINSPNRTNGTFSTSPGGTAPLIYCKIRKVSGFDCGPLNAANNCFYVLLTATP